MAGSSSGCLPCSAGPAQVAREYREQDRAEGEARPRPGRPALLAAVGERQHDRDQARRQQGGARQVQVAGLRGPGFGDQPPRRRQGDQADRHVDPEDGPPSEAGHVRVDEHAADQLPADGRYAHDHAVDADRADPVAAGVGHAEDRHDVRRHDRAARPLYEARRDQEAGIGGDGAQRRGEHEGGQSDAEAPAATVVVAQAPAPHQEGRAGQGVPGDQPLDGGRACVQAALDVGQSHVDDEEVEDVDEGPGQYDGERGPLGDTRDRNGARVPLLGCHGHTRSLGSPITGGSRRPSPPPVDHPERSAAVAPGPSRQVPVGRSTSGCSTDDRFGLAAFGLVDLLGDVRQRHVRVKERLRPRQAEVEFG